MSGKITKITALLLAVALILAIPLASEDKPTAEKDDYKLIEKNVREWIGVLTSKEIAGRRSGQPGLARAEAYLTGLIRDAGLKPLGSVGVNGYLQPVPLVELSIDLKKTFIELGTEKKHQLKWLDDYVARPMGPAEPDVSSELVFAGFGIVASEYKYDSYDGLDVKGKTVLIIDGEPVRKDVNFFDGPSVTVYSRKENKLRWAREHGAVAALFVSGKKGRGGDLFTREKAREGRRQLAHIALNSEKARASFPYIVLSNKIRDSLLKKTGKDINALMESLSNGMKPSEVTIDEHVKLSFQFGLKREFSENNILAVLPGKDPKLKDEYVIIGAHYDHQGIMPDGTIYPGADDNASGVAAALSAVKDIKENSSELKRSILLALWTGEERGLLGSTYFSEMPQVGYHKISAYLNLDMVGRNHMNEEKNRDFLMVFVSTQAPELAPILRAAARVPRLMARVIKSDKMGGGSGGSDHMNFHNYYIPSVFFWSGIHPDYEKPSDTPDKLNYNKIARVARMVAVTALTVANLDKKVKFDAFLKDDRTKKRARPF